MKVVAFNGSARKDGNTAILIRTVFSELEKAGIETELFQLAGKKIRGCIACYKCMENKDRRCSVKKDVLNECIEKMEAADGSSWDHRPICQCFHRDESLDRSGRLCGQGKRRHVPTEGRCSRGGNAQGRRHPRL